MGVNRQNHEALNGTRLNSQLSLRDGFGRNISYLRLSVTDRCDLRCVYCMAEHMNFIPKEQIMTLEELLAVAEIFTQMGVTKIRLTGGEPLVRKNIMWLVERLGQLPDLKELTLTTNGNLLEQYANNLFNFGVKRINVSLDSLDESCFAKITRGGKLVKVLKGLEQAKKVGLKIKINTVILRGVNDGEVHNLITWAGQEGYDLTFIEVMPLGDMDDVANANNSAINHVDNGDSRKINLRAEQYYPLSLLRAEILRRWQLQPTDYQTGGPARYYNCLETGRRIGFITPMTHNFCANCNRVRLSATGKLYLCLGQEFYVDLKSAYRQAGRKGLVRVIQQALPNKPEKHDFVIQREMKKPLTSAEGWAKGLQNNKLARYMNETGG